MTTRRPTSERPRERFHRQSFGDWLRAVSPGWDWDWRHLAYARRKLDQITAGTLKRLMLFMPPQHGKSEQGTVRYPAYRLEDDPTLRVAIATYNQRKANSFSRKTRKIARERIALSRERTAANEWETEAGGRFLAVGVGGSITGEPVDLLILDDVIKGREEAESEAHRERVWDWYRDDIYTRLQPGAAVVLIQTRWHQDDLPGRILESEDAGEWEVVNLPALAEADDPLGREPGEVLCPERFTEEEIQARRRVLGEHGFGSLYQGRPTPREGNLVKRHWLKLVASSPRMAARVRYWDKAGTEGGTGAATAGVLMAKDALGTHYVEHVVRGRWSAGQRNEVMRQTAAADRERYGHVRHVVEQEPGSGGKESAEATVRLLAGYDVRIDRVTGDKLVRFLPFAAQCEAGNVCVVRGEWNQAYIDEVTSFPGGRWKDQSDGSSGALNTLAGCTVTQVIDVPDQRDRHMGGVDLDQKW